ncbi:MAG: hypothetical protein E7415_05960 [Ruminococcaceae bacterium]|nr:hypothetical protein [Oscillospiraceae bacterium]
MINFLTAPLPESITIGKENYPINTDFRVWIEIQNTLENPDLSNADKIIRFFSLAFISPVLPASIEEALSALSEFLSPLPKGEGGSGGKCNTPSFSFIYDGGLIYAAFLSQYGIDLSSAQLHWWRFLALFYSLDNCRFTDIVSIRNADLSSVKDPDYKRFLRKQKRIYRIPTTLPDISSEISKIF